MLKIQNIETRYDAVYALRGVSIDVARGSITAVLGPNGAGKSTLLNTVMGLLDDQPEKGTIEYQGRRIDGDKTENIVRLGIGYVPEGREIFEELTVRENLMMGAYLRRDRSGIARDRDRVFSHFPILVDRENQLAGTLSGGEQQMLAMGRALMNRPELLLLDEPSLGLSPQLVSEVFEIIQAIRSDGVTVLIVEQNARMALRLADAGFVLENGRFAISGASSELMEDADVQEFYLGVQAETSVRGTRRYKRRKRWR